jgi:PAS domain S-box-containing protein
MYLARTALVVVATQAATIVALVALLIRARRRARAEQALRECEAQFRLTLDRSPVMIWTARPDTKLDYLNSSCVEFTGLPVEQLLDEGWLGAVHAEDLDTCIATYVPAVEARVPFVLEYRLRRADGAYRWVLDTCVPKFAADGNFTGYIGACVDITERREAEDLMRDGRAALEVSHREIQALAGQLITAHEDECRHLARELHDDLTQRLARLAIDAGRLAQGTSEDVGAMAASMRSDLVRLSEDVHTLSYRLHPSVLDDLGLVDALRTECDRVSRRGPLRVDVDTSGIARTLPAEASLCLFRVAQEALGNVERHANASTATVLLTPRDNGLQLAVSDDGNGFDPAQARTHASLGLASMRERVRFLSGELEIKSTPGCGTTVVAWVPA